VRRSQDRTRTDGLGFQAASGRPVGAVVGVWNLILTVTLAPPVAAFLASFSHQPVWSDGAWTWPYDFTVLGVPHSARLEARFVPACTWSLSMGPANPTAFIDIEWNRAQSGATYDIKYTNVATGTSEYGSYIRYGVTGLTPYDAFYDIYGAQADNLTEIEWNRTTKEGRTRDPAYFLDSDWRCWASNLDNTTCQ
jgi:hypothetical protein